MGASRGIPAEIGAAIVILYLVTFSYWVQLLHFDLSLVVQRVCFLTVALTVLMAGLKLPASDAIGRLSVPCRADLKFVAVAMAVAVLIRLALKFVARSIVHGTDMQTLTAWRFMYECVIPPINEEPIFRGLLLMSLLSIFQSRRILPVVLAALIFSSVHYVHDVEKQIATFMLGCLLGTVFLRTRSLSSCMLLHAVWNVMVFVRLPFV